MKIAILGDTHVGARNDSILFNDFFLKFFDDIFFPYLEKHQDIKTIVHLGDVFDKRKTINFRILNLWKRIFSKLSEYSTYLIPGNHDLYDRVGEINSLTELFGQYNFQIYSEPTEVTFEKLKVLILKLCVTNQR